MSNIPGYNSKTNRDDLNHLWWSMIWKFQVIFIEKSDILHFINVCIQNWEIFELLWDTKKYSMEPIKYQMKSIEPITDLICRFWTQFDTEFEISWNILNTISFLRFYSINRHFAYPVHCWACSCLMIDVLLCFEFGEEGLS